MAYTPDPTENAYLENVRTQAEAARAVLNDNLADPDATLSGHYDTHRIKNALADAHKALRQLSSTASRVQSYRGSRGGVA